MDTKNGGLEKAFWVSTCVKINMEPKNRPIEKENHLPSTSIFGFHVNLPGYASVYVQFRGGTVYRSTLKSKVTHVFVGQAVSANG